MARKIAGNTFEKGLAMDFNPISTPNNVMTSALNATIITFNGNEYILQTDMGNGRVETAYLPAGYVPVGMVEFGGVIYVASYSPFLNRGQMGSFPSPERNISTDEISDTIIKLSNKDFNFNERNGATTLYVQKALYSEKLSPGDKFLVYVDKGNVTNNHDGNCLYDCYTNEPNYYKREGNQNGALDTKAVEVYFATITDEGKIARLNRLRDYQIEGEGEDYIIPEMDKNADGTANVDSYRSLVESPYNVFNSKVSGQLLLIAELITIDNFSVSIVCEFDEQENGTDNNLRDVKITAQMYYESDDNVFLYAVTAVISDTGGDQGQNKSIEWEATSPEDTEQISSNRKMEAVMTTIEGYDIKERKERTISYTLTPCMTWGPISYLARSGVIQLDKVGSGYIEMYEWRYFKNTDSIILGWALQAYPEEGYSIAGVRFIMSCLANDGKVRTIIYNVSKKNSYSGSFTETIPLGVEYYKIESGENDKDIPPVLLPNRLYYVTIEVQYCKGGDATITDKFKYFYRWLYTTDAFNGQYREGKVADFRPLQPDIKFGINSEISASLSDLENITNYSEPLLSTTGGLSQYQYLIRQYSGQYNIVGDAELVITSMTDLLKLTKDSCKMTATITQDDMTKSISTQNVGTLGDGVAFGLEEKATIKIRENSERDPFIPVLPPAGEKPVDGELPEEWDFSSDMYQNDIHLLIPEGEFTKEGTTSLNISAGEVVVETLEYAKLVGYMAENQSVQYQCMIEPCCYKEEDYLNYTLKFNTETGKFNGTILPGLNDVDDDQRGDDPHLSWALIPETGNGTTPQRGWSGQHKDEMSFVGKDGTSFYNTTIMNNGNLFSVLLRYPMFALAICAAGDENQNEGDVGMSVQPNTGLDFGSSVYRDLNWWIDKTGKYPFANTTNPIYPNAPVSTAEKLACISYTQLDKKWEYLIEPGITYVTMMRLASDHDLSVPINMFTPLTANSIGEARTKPYEFMHFNFMAQMLSQLYVCNNEGGVLTGVTKPVLIAYTDRIVTDFTVSIKFEVDSTGFTAEVKIDEDATPEVPVIIDSTYRENMWTNNHNEAKNDENDVMPTLDDIPDEENNIKFVVSDENTSVIATCLIQNMRNVQDLANESAQYLEGSMQTLIMKPDLTTLFSNIRGESGKVYYIIQNETTGEYTPSVLNNGFYLYDVLFEERTNNTGEKYYVPTVNPDNPDPISTTGAFNNVLVSEGKTLYINDINDNDISVLRGNRIRNQSINGKGTADTIWNGYCLFAPIKLLKALDKRFVKEE